MTFFRANGPDVEPVTLNEAKAYLRISHMSEDNLIENLIAAAREEVEQQTGRALMEQTWRMTMDHWPKGGTLKLPRMPVQSVPVFVGFDAAGYAVNLDTDLLLLDGYAEPATLTLKAPLEPASIVNGIELEFIAGYGGTVGTSVPDTLKRAILVLVAHWFEFRGTYSANDQPVSFPSGFERLIRNFRTVSL